MSSIGVLQRIPAEELTLEIMKKKEKYALHVDYNMLPSSGKIIYVGISNRYASNEETKIHGIRIEGQNGMIGRALRGLISAIKTIGSKIKSAESAMMQAIEEQRKMGNIVVPGLSDPFSREDLRKYGLEILLPEYGLGVRMSRFPNQDIVFIIKGIEKEVVYLR